MTTFNRIFAAATAGLIALTLALTAADIAGADLTGADLGNAPAQQLASVDATSHIG